MKVFISSALIFLSYACVPQGSGGSSTKKTTEISSTGDDPLATYAWHLENTGQSSFSEAGGISGEDLKIKQVYDSGIKGNGIRIAISDSGVDTNHPDLYGNQLVGEHRNYSTTSNWRNGDPYPTEGEGHGSAVAGLIAALSGNGIGSRGVAPSSKFSAFYFIGNFHDTNSSYEAKTLDQLTGNFDIFNYSYGYSGCAFYPTTSSVVDAYKSGVSNLRNGKGAIYVKAAGNDYIGQNSDCYSSDRSSFIGNSNTSEDQNIPYLILTGAVNARGVASSYSTPGSGLWISSAGGEFGTRSPAMITTDIQGCSSGISVSSSTSNDFNKGVSTFNPYCNYTNIMNGTSSATPTLAGIIALMLEANPGLTWRDVKHILAVTASKINLSYSAISHPAGTNLSGHIYDQLYVRNAANFDFSNTYGFGRVNAHAAVELAKTYTSQLGSYVETSNPNTSSWYYDSGSINLTIPDHDVSGVNHSLNVLHNYVIESVQLKISTNHTHIGDLAVELTSASGTKSRLLLINSNIKESGLSDFTLISNAFYGEQSRGSWKIEVIDGGVGDTGVLENWKIKINGHIVTSSTDTIAPAPVTNILFSGSTSSTTQSPTVSFTPPSDTDILRYEVAIGTTSGGSEKAAFYSIGNATSFQTRNLSLQSGQTYSLSIRAVDTSENHSTVATQTWTVQ